MSGSTQSSDTPATPAFSFHRYAVGDATIVAVFDGRNPIPLADGFVPNASRADVSAALAAAGGDPDIVPITFTPIVIENGSRRIVIDTGTGEANVEASGGKSGWFQTNLTAAGIDRREIDTVIISHFHGDHINGLLTRDGHRAFPNAEILVPQAEWDFWMDDARMAAAPNDRAKAAFANARRVFDQLNRQVTHYAWDKEAAPGITAVGTPGHTPGHTSFRAKFGGETVFIQSDVTNLPALFARHPHWQAAFDYDGEMAVATRLRIYTELAAAGTRVQGFHYPFPGLARLEKLADGFNAIPVSA
ncbi:MULTISPECIES: MBL fold metallo-hydrolase [unclassified Chelatococcus]|jgi:glyoxylase-like metal-dependent hydrolase (beta-lactamase superfamily II)|uniref:MBL fold metallo-hydrolase n=1 Tax=unclassified Chelatococcus TaxID=2638111 RepID=UPI001BCE27E0|nr:MULTISPECIES: MBL fold metallo-hydrolase [unclassified Chelatococcus]CAH1672155.1 Glyoxylase-like metal-dependent hydrolase (Beta-lactamase superfamily II) [Hyphomicrobiales bacterium]MBS7738984.1 MBL fold metallo-hydrolase [Chelatococcus sp. HY11]MBX3543417.1 MBL fold metallo-hydrolase [Chelatococcus sp.]MCO5076486.1 MBL fold metallo-hydrolase [Chelatococcus sp.]CAH1675624.1 Glyoxylase-like metal-dependent hydrolase (Beta-lactamase superfamily II) [Hyphomicrobiales bacterium]